VASNACSTLLCLNSRGGAEGLAREGGRHGGGCLFGPEDFGRGLSSFSNNAAAKRLKSGQGNAAFDIARGKTKLTKRRPAQPKGARTKLRAKDRPLANDFVSDEEFDRLLAAWFGNMARVLEPGRGFYIWGGYANCANYPPVLKANGLYFSQAIIWVKEHPVLTRKDFMGAFEISFYGWREGAAHVYLGPNNATDLWHVKKVNPQSNVPLNGKPV